MSKLNLLIKKLRQAKAKLKQWAVEQLLLETGVRLDPDPDTWGILSKTEEEIVLSRIYQDKLFTALLRKYAEGANKAIIARVDADKEYWKFRAQFFCYNMLLLKSRRAFLKLKDEQQNRA